MSHKLLNSAILTVLYCLIVNTVNAQVVTLFAGNSTNGYAGDGGPATASTCMLHRPHDITHDASGNFYFTEYDNYIVRKVSNTGIITTIAGTGSPDMGVAPLPTGVPATSVDLSGIGGIVIDGSGNVFFGEGTQIRKISPSGIFTTFAGNSIGGYSGDGGPATAAAMEVGAMTFDAVGNLYISQYNNNVIRKITTAGIISTVVGQGPGLGGGYSGDGGPATAAKLLNPRDVKFDAAGNMYVLDGSGTGVRKVNTAGIITTVAGNFAAAFGYTGDGGPATNARLNNATQIKIDGAGIIYISDHGNNVIRKINSAGIISTYVGTGSWIWNGSGLAGTATNLWGPQGLDIYSGKLYFCEGGHSVIRKIDAPTTEVPVLSTSYNDIQILPNPTTGSYTLSGILATDGVLKISLLDITGKILLSDNINTINRAFSKQFTTDNLSPGLYFVKILSADNTTTLKLIKQ